MMPQYFQSKPRKHSMKLKKPFPRKYVGLSKWIIGMMFIASFILSTLYFVDYKLRPSLQLAASALARRVATEALNQALTEELAHTTDESDIVHVETTGSHPELTVARFNLHVITALQSDATKQAELAMHQLSKQTIRLPFGHIFGGSVLSTTQMNVPVHLYLIGNAHSSIYADVKSVGVNQTVHILYLQLSADVNVVAPFVTQTTEVDSRSPIAYIVLAGSVPNTYFGSGKSSTQTVLPRLSTQP